MTFSPRGSPPGSGVATSDLMPILLSWFDVASLVLYFVVLFVVGFVVSRNQRSRQQANASSEGFFLAERSVSWWAVAASLFASNIGTEHFVGLAGSAARDGISVVWYELGAIPVILLLAFVLLPTYLNARIMTMPDYLEQRYSVLCRQVIVVLSLLLYVFTKVAATLFAGQIIVVELLDMDATAAVVLLILFTSLYTVTGGLEAVIYTEALQTIVLIVGGFLVLGFTLSATGGLSSMREELPDSYFHIFRPATDPTYPWTGFVVGYYCVSIWYWGCDQVIVQRALAARNIAHGQAGCVGAALLKVLPFALMVVPGLGAKTLMVRAGITTSDVGLNQHNMSSVVDFDKAYPWLVKTAVPLHFRGIIIAGMLASLMSSLASVFNSASTIFTLDIWRVQYPDASERSLVLVGRVAVVALGVSALLWLPVIPLMGDRLFLIIQKPPAYMAPPVVSVFLWGVLTSVPRARGAEWALGWGLTLGGLRFFAEVIEDVLGYKSSPGTIFGVFTSVNYLHFAIVSFVASTAVLFSVSLALRGSARDPGTPDPRFMFASDLFEKLMVDAAECEPKPLTKAPEAVELQSDMEECRDSGKGFSGALQQGGIAGTCDLASVAGVVGEEHAAVTQLEIADSNIDDEAEDRMLLNEPLPTSSSPVNHASRAVSSECCGGPGNCGSCADGASRAEPRTDYHGDVVGGPISVALCGTSCMSKWNLRAQGATVLVVFLSIVWSYR